MEKTMKEIVKIAGEFLKAVLKVILFGEQPPHDDNHPGKASQ